MTEPFVGEIMLVPFTFAPDGWAECDGRLLPITQNTGLFSLLGITYGGNGVSTFALPDLRGRRAIGQGLGPGLSNFAMGEVTGTESVTLTSNEIPFHLHAARAVRGGAGAGPTTSPSGAAWANEVKGTPQNLPYTAGPGVSPMRADALATAGANAPHENRPPYLVLKYVIALEGIFPARN